jgi:hypothetical protein
VYRGPAVTSARTTPAPVTAPAIELQSSTAPSATVARIRPAAISTISTAIGINRRAEVRAELWTSPPRLQAYRRATQLARPMMATSAYT